jgi:hypothetical protein
MDQFYQFDFAIATMLQDVRMFAHPDLPKGAGVIELSFSNCKVFVSIQDEHDTLLCTEALPETHFVYMCPISASFWDPVIRKALISAWRMTDERGYPDAIQLRFRDLPNSGSYTIVQLCGEASQITLTELKVVRESSICVHAEIS